MFFCPFREGKLSQICFWDGSADCREEATDAVFLHFSCSLVCSENVLFSESGETQFVTRLRRTVSCSTSHSSAPTLCGTLPSLRNPSSLKSTPPQRNYQHCFRATFVTRTSSTVPLVIRVSGSLSRWPGTASTQSGACRRRYKEKDFFLTAKNGFQAVRLLYHSATELPFALLVSCRVARWRQTGWRTDSSRSGCTQTLVSPPPR